MSKEIEVVTMAVLASGVIVYQFEGEDKLQYLEKMGEFLIWSPNCWHKTEALADTTLFSIRWPK